MDKYQDSVNDALLFIKTNYSRMTRKDVVSIINERIFLNEFNHEQNAWVKKATNMQELQCVDCVMKFFESESNAQIRDFMFDLLFGDIYQVKSMLTVLMSYSISLEAQNTLDCISKWIIANIGNELVQTMVNQIIKDHFVMTVTKGDASEPESPLAPNLVALVNRSPLFASLFMTITLDMLPNELLGHPDKCLPKIIKLFEAWIEKNEMLPIIAYKSNMLHASAYMLNPLPGLIYITVVYAIKSLVDELTALTDRDLAKSDEVTVRPNDFVDKVHLITLKILRDLSNTLEPSKVKQSEQFKLLTLNHLEFVCKQVGEAESKLKDHVRLRGLEAHADKLGKTFRRLFNDSIDKLAQVIELSIQYGFVINTKTEIRNTFASFMQPTDGYDQELARLEPSSLLEIVLCS